MIAFAFPGTKAIFESELREGKVNFGKFYAGIFLDTL